MIGVAVLSSGLLVFFRFRQLWRYNNAVLFVCSLALGTAVTGVHYTGMASATYYQTVQTPDTSNMASGSAILSVNVSLCAATCCSTLLYVCVKHIRTLQAETRKRSCLVLNALVLDSSTPPRVLCTVTNMLPSVVIEEQYEGVGHFDTSNPDFLRMYKQSADWVEGERYTALLERREARNYISGYSLSLHRKFNTAAEQLGRQCGLQRDELGMLHWKPTHAVVTMVIRVSSEVGENHENHKLPLCLAGVAPPSH